MKANELLRVMPDSYSRAIMELIASEGNDTDKVLNALQQMTVMVAALTGVEPQKLLDGLVHHLEAFDAGIKEPSDV